jgi:hypothetical protein
MFVLNEENHVKLPAAYTEIDDDHGLRADHPRTQLNNAVFLARDEVVKDTPYISCWILFSFLDTFPKLFENDIKRVPKRFDESNHGSTNARCATQACMMHENDRLRNACYPKQIAFIVNLTVLFLKAIET